MTSGPQQRDPLYRLLRRYFVAVTENTEYHVRRCICIGIRNRKTGEWQDAHPLLHCRYLGSANAEQTYTEYPTMAASLWFHHKTNGDILTSAIRLLRAPTRSERERLLPRPGTSRARDTRQQDDTGAHDLVSDDTSPTARRHNTQQIDRQEVLRQLEEHSRNPAEQTAGLLAKEQSEREDETPPEDSLSREVQAATGNVAPELAKLPQAWQPRRIPVWALIAAAVVLAAAAVTLLLW